MSVISSYLREELSLIFRFNIPLTLMDNIEPMFWAMWRYGTPVIVKLIYSIHI